MPVLRPSRIHLFANNIQASLYGSVRMHFILNFGWERLHEELSGYIGYYWRICIEMRKGERQWLALVEEHCVGRIPLGEFVGADLIVGVVPSRIINENCLGDSQGAIPYSLARLQTQDRGEAPGRTHFWSFNS